MSLPLVPESSPFSPEQRSWLNGYVAALFGEGGSAGSVSATEKQKVLVMYASQSGNSEGLAEELGEMLSADFSAPVISTEDFSEIDLTSETHLFLIASTWGDGDPPDNAIDFWSFLQSDDAPKLDQLNYSVLALGDSNYLQFCAQGKAFDARLEELGAKRMVPRVDCDTDFEDLAEEWMSNVVTALGASASSKEDSPAAEVTYSKSNPFPAFLKTNRKLNTPESERDTRHFEFDLSGSGLSYQCGDVLGVYGKNDPALVDELIETLQLDPESNVIASKAGEMSLRTALIAEYDVRALSPKLLEAWAEYSESIPESAEWLEGRDLIDLVVEYPAKFESGQQFVDVLRKMGPRLYSISSSPKAHEDEVHLTVATVNYETHGRARKGVCSTYLADRVNGDGTVKVFLQTAKHFRLPEDTNRPVIMVGPGTGVAPFRAFLEERIATEAPGKNWMFFGNPHEDTDWLYKDEFNRYQEEGQLDRYDKAWSRDGDTKVYVQDLIRENGQEIWKWLSEDGHFYVCGDAKRMAKDVDDALHEVISTYGGVDAEDYVSAMKKEKRYQRDVY
ncbi:MAG: sulfite reductase subunit alpha [Verrucomicrobiota bacterium]